MWKNFLSGRRIGSSKSTSETAKGLRSEFHKDYDRIIFSSAFRRLSDKTQVVPFPKSDYTRQRLTHSLEVSCVGRSLATSVYEMVRPEIGSLVSQGDFEAVVAAACLAHDIGNPPFGHFGEKAIQDWSQNHLSEPVYSSLSEAEQRDFRLFEGNAQSFRVLTRLQMSNRRGGMRLTAATLGALIKYPRPSLVTNPRYKKHGHFQDDAELFAEVFEAAGRSADDDGQYARHPLALLSEAADDICYAIIDLEDGCKAGLISGDEALDILEKISPNSTGSNDMPAADRLSMGRAMVINELVQQSVQVFQDHRDQILQGSFEGALVDRTAVVADYKRAKDTAFQLVFLSDDVLEQEAAGYQAIHGLMDILSSAVLSENPNGFDKHVLRLTRIRVTDDMSAYQKLLACTDTVSGMTDRYCVELFRKLTGHAIA